jgi:alpha-ketoglutarate-dependent 2,4-dichlorophenoxyacetate dioxygenase
MSELRLTPLHSHFAARLEGLDSWQTLTRQDIQFIEEAVAHYAVIVIPQLVPNDADHIRFSRMFGGLELPRKGGYFNDYVSRIAPELFDAGNLDVRGEIMKPDEPLRRFAKGNELWHTDSSFNALPVKWSLLLAYAIPPAGGETQFADMRWAHEALPKPRQSEIADLMVIHDLWHSRGRGGYKSDEREHQRMRPVIKPLVRISASRRPALYLGAHAATVLEWPREKGQALLAELADFATQTDNIYTHRWQVGDLVIWDNRCTLHRGLPFNTFEYKRDMRRTTILECADDRDASMAEIAGTADVL